MKRTATLFAAACVALRLQAATPKQMQAIVEGIQAWRCRPSGRWSPAPARVLVKVYAADVNPVDWKRKPPVPGFDAAGVIEDVGPDVTAFKMGEPVVARVTGGYAQRVQTSGSTW